MEENERSEEGKGKTGVELDVEENLTGT